MEAAGRQSLPRGSGSFWDPFEDDDFAAIANGGDQGAGFLFKAVAARRVGVEFGGKDFDGDVALEAGVTGFVDFAHAAGAEGCEDFVGTEFGSGEEQEG